MFHYSRAVIKAGPSIIGGYFSWMRPYAKNPKKVPYPKIYSKISSVCKKVSEGFNVSYHIEGKENIPNQPFCLFSNHLSAFDPVAYLSIIDYPLTFIAKKESEHYPFIGTCMKAISGEFIDRNDLKQSLKVMMKVQKDLSEGNRSWLIFVEGTRNKDQLKLLNEYHHGTFRAAMKAKVPLINAVIYGSFKVFRRKKQLKKYPVFIKILKPLHYEDYKDMSTEEVASYFQREAQKVLTYEARIYYHNEISKQKNKKYRFNEII